MDKPVAWGITYNIFCFLHSSAHSLKLEVSSKYYCLTLNCRDRVNGLNAVHTELLSPLISNYKNLSGLMKVPSNPEKHLVIWELNYLSLLSLSSLPERIVRGWVNAFIAKILAVPVVTNSRLHNKTATHIFRNTENSKMARTSQNPLFVKIDC